MPTFSLRDVLRVAILTPRLLCESLTTILPLYDAHDENASNNDHLLAAVVLTVFVSRSALPTNAIVKTSLSLFVPLYDEIPNLATHFYNRHN